MRPKIIAHADILVPEVKPLTSGFALWLDRKNTDKKYCQHVLNILNYNFKSDQFLLNICYDMITVKYMYK